MPSYLNTTSGLMPTQPPQQGAVQQQGLGQIGQPQQGMPGLFDHLNAILANGQQPGAPMQLQGAVPATSPQRSVLSSLIGALATPAPTSGLMASGSTITSAPQAGASGAGRMRFDAGLGLNVVR